MKIVVIGGSGLIGSTVVARLREHGHEAVPASPDTGVDTLTGQGLAEVLAGAAVVVAAGVVGRTAVGDPLNGRVETGGPERFRFDDFVRDGLAARKDPRTVVTDPHARYFGTECDSEGSTPAARPHLPAAPLGRRRTSWNQGGPFPKASWTRQGTPGAPRPRRRGPFGSQRRTRGPG